jgi:hypothetical protein
MKMTFSNDMTSAALESQLDLLSVLTPVAARDFEKRHGSMALIVERYTDMAIHPRIESLFSRAMLDAAWYADRGDRACIHSSLDAFEILNRASGLLSPVAVEVCRSVIRDLLRAMPDRRIDAEARASIKASIGKLLDNIVENHKIVDILAADDRIARAN